MSCSYKGLNYVNNQKVDKKEQVSGQILESGSDPLPDAVARSGMLLSIYPCNAIKKVYFL